VQAARPHLEAGDAVIATASEEALKGSNTMIDYAAAKAALVNFTKSIAPHLAKDGIRANVVAPGPTWTVLNVADQHMPQDGLAQLGSEGPLGRVAQPEEIAPTYVYLASDADSSYTVGEIIAVTGGLTNTRGGIGHWADHAPCPRHRSKPAPARGMPARTALARSV